MADDKALKMATRLHGEALRRDTFDAALYGTSEVRLLCGLALAAVAYRRAAPGDRDELLE